jgi:TolB-like protein
MDAGPRAISRFRQCIAQQSERFVLANTTARRIAMTQLVQVPIDAPMWAQSYEEDLQDTLALQGKVARDIASRLPSRSFGGRPC